MQRGIRLAQARPDNNAPYPNRRPQHQPPVGRALLPYATATARDIRPTVPRAQEVARTADATLISWRCDRLVTVPLVLYVHLWLWSGIQDGFADKWAHIVFGKTHWYHIS
jgi:hypothetical protein